jgi:hypothetical protein
VRPHDGPYDGAAAARFGWGARNPLVAVLLPAGQAGPLRSGAFSFLSLDSDHVLLTTLKIAEDGEAAGIVARLWETGGAPATVTLDLSALLPLAAERTDLVERPLGPLPLVSGRTTVSVPANGFATVRFRSAGVATGVGEAGPPDPATPRAVLARVRPNPFVPGASLSFDVAVGAGEVGVRLELYDTRGRLVRALVDGRLGSGRHRAAWDGRDGSGRRVASGVYVARLVTPDGTSAQKLVLID